MQYRWGGTVGNPPSLTIPKGVISPATGAGLGMLVRDVEIGAATEGSARLTFHLRENCRIGCPELRKWHRSGPEKYFEESRFFVSP